jgi:serine/threonine protein kinase
VGASSHAELQKEHYRSVDTWISPFSLYTLASVMVSSLPKTMILRQRYLIDRVLGQGGFARTYLAMDQERFQESCVIKEFFVSYQDESLIHKAKDLFHRESSILHQIQHPQIPRFWAAFEEDGRLFLVQDYVKGETYRSLLNQRKKEERAFTETEVLHFLAHILPVLSYLHDRNIVHRDISPDNIMLPPSSESSTGEQSLPILIDFGAVKEATSGLSLVSSMTRVGKIGYAPPEQLQTGNVQPHSDLYSLAATCLVLLTGREPSSLLNSQTLQWQWEAHAVISESLASILRRMLSLHPGDRYVSARRIWLDLLPLLGDQAPVTQMLMDPENPADIEFASSSVQASIEAATPASAKRNFFLKPAVTRVQQDRSSSPISLNWVSPRIAIVGSLFALLGMGTFIFRSPMLSSSAQMLEDKATVRSSVPAVVTKPGEPSEILFDVGEMSKMIPGSLQGNSVQVYTLKALRGQIMSASLNGSSVLMNISRANGMPLESSSWQTRSWTGTLPADDTYSVQVSGTGVYALDLSVTPLNREVSVGTQRLKFPLGKASTMVTGTLKPKEVKRYITKVQNNKMMILSGSLDDVAVTVITPRGDRIGGTTVQSKSWQGRLPMDGDYVVEVATDKVKSDYQLSIEMY